MPGKADTNALNAFKQSLHRSLWPKFQILKIKLGTGLKTSNDFRRALKINEHKIDGWGNDILSKPAFMVSEIETEVNLAVISVAELGFRDGATRKNIYDRASSLDLGLCPNEVGPQLRLQYRDQPNGERLLIGMDPITDSSGSLGIFSVEQDLNNSWLRGDDGLPSCFWTRYYWWVFLVPRITQLRPSRF